MPHDSGGDDDIEAFLNNPVAYVIGGLSGIVAVVFAVGVDPISAIQVIFDFAIVNANPIFTATSIGAFTLGRLLPPRIESALTITALVFAAIVFGKILDELWEAFKGRFLDD